MNNNLRKSLYLLLLLLPTASPVQAQTIEMAQSQIDKLAKIETDSLASYADSYTYDEEYFAENEPATIYYPKNLEGKVPAVIVVHGFNCKQKFLQKIPQHLSSHGFICITYTALDRKRPFQWPPGLMAAYEILRGESMRPDSPIYDHVDFDAVALVGHSMGGAGHVVETQLIGAFRPDAPSAVLRSADHIGGVVQGVPLCVGIGPVPGIASHRQSRSA